MHTTTGQEVFPVEAGQREVSTQQVNVVPIISEIAEAARIFFGKKPVTVTVTTPNLPVMINTDPIKLRQVLMNLVSNAAKFTEAGRIDITLSILGSSLAIAISDTGLSREDVKTEQHQGTGLGLIISRDLVELIGGRISITNTHGKGTTVVVSLPLQIAENQRELYNAD